LLIDFFALKNFIRKKIRARGAARVSDFRRKKTVSALAQALALLVPTGRKNTLKNFKIFLGFMLIM